MNKTNIKEMLNASLLHVESLHPISGKLEKVQTELEEQRIKVQELEVHTVGLEGTVAAEASLAGVGLPAGQGHAAPGGAALSFLSAIDDGLILTLGRGRDIVETLDAGLDVRGAQGRAPDVVLGFDCVLRKLEIEQKQLSGPVSEIFRDRRVVGFNTYGEQHCGVHVNQTFVGVAFFDPPPSGGLQ